MGRLRRLELENFKSYLGVQIIGPFDDFTAIIGPNGAGKSNMMDAISFVLGIQSRHLRSTHLKELIFRRDIHSPPARRASVKLVYELSEDELDGSEEGKEMIFSRSISASGVSTYRLDGKEVTFEMYEDVLQKIGVLVKARNFLVFQGDVESVASKSPLELTRLLEQISGSDALQREYDDLRAKKEQAEETAIFSMQKKKMYVTQRKEVKAQKDEAEHFQQQQQVLDDLKTELTLWQIYRITSDMQTYQQTREDYVSELEKIADAEREADDELGEGKRLLGKMNKRVTALDKDCAQADKTISNITPKLTVAKEKVRKLEKRRGEQDKVKAKMQQDISTQEENLEGLREDMGALEEAEEVIDRQLQREAAKGGLHLGRGELDEYSSLREVASMRTAKERAESLVLEKDVAGMRSRVEEMASQEAFARQEAENTEAFIAEYTERMEKLRECIAQGLGEKNDLARERDSLVAVAAECEEKGRLLGADLEEVSATLQDAGDARRATRHEERLAEALETMQSIYPGVHGKLAELCRPVQKKFSQAISVAGGKNMDAIVVDTKQTAAECIRYLKDQRIGACSFLPLDNIFPKDIPDRLRGLGGRYRVCADLIDAEEVYRPAVLYAVGSTVVCDSLEDARELCFTRGERVKAVSLSGHVISKSGSMTGGSTAGRDSKDRWEEKEMDKLRKRKVELEEAVAENRRRTPGRQHTIDIETKLKTLQTRMNLCDADLKVCEEKLAQLKQQQVLRDKNSSDLRKELKSTEKTLEKKQRRLSDLEGVIRSVESEVFHDFSSRMGVENIRDFEETRLRQHKELILRKNEVAEQRATLQAQLEYETKRDFQGALKTHLALITSAEKEIAAQSKVVADLDKQMAQTQKLSEDLRRKRDELRREKKTQEEELRALQQQRSDISAERDAALKKISGQEIHIERLRSQLHETLRKAEVEEVALPAVLDEAEEAESGARSNKQVEGMRGGTKGSKRTKTGESSVGELARASSDSFTFSSELDLRWRGSTTSLRSSSSSANIQGGSGRSVGRRGGNSSSEDGSSASSSYGGIHFSESDNPVVQRDSEKVAMVDLSSLRAIVGSDRHEVQVEKEKQLSQEISELVAELESMQPNMHAGERYDGVVEKLKDCTADLDQVRDEAKGIASRFEEVRDARQKLFQTCFQHVSESLAVIYKDLTRSSKHPLGGNAYLSLDNTEEPYIGGVRYTAMPPSKRFRDMDQLSGGEKTVAALALLFSIHSFRQAPFFVLDEVDAALDNVNVQKVCNYIRQQSKHFQCVVISLKDMFFEHADILVGVCKDIESVSSRVLTLSLNQFPVTKPDAVPQQQRRQQQQEEMESPVSSPLALADRLQRELAANDEDDNVSVMSSEAGSTSTPIRRTGRGVGSPGSSGRKRGLPSSGVGGKAARIEPGHSSSGAAATAGRTKRGGSSAAARLRKQSSRDSRASSRASRRSSGVTSEAIPEEDEEDEEL